MTDTSTANAAPPRHGRLPPAERHVLILDAAVEEFATRGFAGARMATIARRAGVTKGLLYHYFPGGKLDLFRAAISGCVDPLLEEARTLAKEFTGSRWALLEVLINLGYGRPEAEQRENILMKLLLVEADRFPELAALYRTDVLQPAVEMARQVIREGSDAGDFRPGVADEPGFAYVLLAPIIMGTIWRMMLGPEHAPPPEELRTAQLDLLRRSLAP